MCATTCDEHVKPHLVGPHFAKCGPAKLHYFTCPKRDPVDYSEKLAEIIHENGIKSVTIVRMEVPCRGGLELSAKKALQASGKFILWQVVTTSLDGLIISLNVSLA